MEKVRPGEYLEVLERGRRFPPTSEGWVITGGTLLWHDGAYIGAVLWVHHHQDGGYEIAYEPRPREGPGREPCAGRG